MIDDLPMEAEVDQAVAACWQPDPDLTPAERARANAAQLRDEASRDADDTRRAAREALVAWPELCGDVARANALLTALANYHGNHSSDPARMLEIGHPVTDRLAAIARISPAGTALVRELAGGSTSPLLHLAAAGLLAELERDADGQS